MSKSSPEQSVRVNAHGMQWRTSADFAGVLPRLDIDLARRPERPGPAELVKDNLARTLVRMPHPVRPDGPRLYIKRFKFDRIQRKLRQLIRRTQAAREYRASRELLSRGIPTCRALALGEHRRGLFHQEAFVVIEEIPGAVTLAHYAASQRWRTLDYEVRRQVIEELAELVAQMMRSGVCHDDLHLENILIVPSRPPGRRLFVLDLHRVRLKRRSRAGAVRMLVFLADSSRKLGVSSTDQIRFLRVLLEKWKGARAAGPQAVARWARRVRVARERHHRRHMRSRTRRCLIESSRFTRDRAGGFGVWRRRDFPLQAALATVESHETALRSPRHKGLVRKEAARTQISHLPDSPQGALYVKAFLRRSIGERIKDLLRWKGRARAAWIAHRGFGVRGLPIPAGLALLEAHGKLAGRPDYLITEAIEADGDLRLMTCSGGPGEPIPCCALAAGAEHRALAAAVADLFRLLADREVLHSDMKPSNILVRRASGGFRLWLVDLDRARFGVRWRRRHWVHHLAQCNAGLPATVTVLDRMRCLRRCGQARWRPEERLRIARAVLKKSLSRNPQWQR